jgi:hypothetical protein
VLVSYLNPYVETIKKNISNLGFMDFLLSIVLFLPPLIFLDSASRYFNTKVAALELIFVIVFFSHKGIKLSTINYKILLLFLFFALWITITIFFADQKSYAFNRNLCVIVHMVFGFAVWRYLTNYSYRRIYIVYLITFSFFLPAVGTVIYGLMHSESSISLVGDLPFYSNIRHLGYHVAASLIFAVLLFVRASTNFMRILYGLWLCTTVAFLLWSGSRGPVVGLFLSGILLLLVIPSFRKRNAICLLAAFSTLVFLMLIFNLDFLGYGMINRTLAANDFNSLLAGRVNLWSGVLQSIDNWFVGIGGDNFNLLKAAGGFAQAHNVVIQAILDWGIIGAIVFLLFPSISVVKAITGIRSLKVPNHVMNASLSLIIMYLFLSLVDGVFYHGIPFMLFVVSVALVFSFREDSISNHK